MADGYPPAGAGGNRPLLFVIGEPYFFVIARSRRRRGNLAGAQDSLKVIIEPQK